MTTSSYFLIPPNKPVGSAPKKFKWPPKGLAANWAEVLVGKYVPWFGENLLLASVSTEVKDKTFCLVIKAKPGVEVKYLKNLVSSSFF